MLRSTGGRRNRTHGFIQRVAWTNRKHDENRRECFLRLQDVGMRVWHGQIEIHKAPKDLLRSVAKRWNRGNGGVIHHVLRATNQLRRRAEASREFHQTSRQGDARRSQHTQGRVPGTRTGLERQQEVVDAELNRHVPAIMHRTRHTRSKAAPRWLRIDAKRRRCERE